MEKTIQVKIEVPNQLADITLDQYQRYFQILDKIDKDGEDSEIFINLKALEIFCGLELKESYKLPLSHFDVVLNKIANCLTEETPLIKRFWLRGSNGVEVEFGMHPDINNMSFGEYVDLENYISDWKHMHKAMAVLFRPITAKVKDFYEIEEYESASKYEEYMKYMPASVAIGALVFFLSFRDEIVRTYDGLFTESGETGIGIASREQVFGQKWGWYQSVYALAGSDVSRFDEVTKLNIHKCLTWLTFEKERVELENKRIKDAYK